MRRLGAVGALLGCCGLAVCQLTSTEIQALSDALFLSNLEFSNLAKPRSERAPVWMREIIDNPVAGLGKLETLHSAASQRSLPQLMGLLRAAIDPSSNFTSEPAPSITMPDEVPEALRPSLTRLISALLVSSDLVRDASQKLSPAERRTLIEGLPRLAVPESALKLEFVRQPMPDVATLDGLLSRVDLPRIRFAGQALAQAVQEELPKLRESSRGISLPTKLKLTIQGAIVELGGSGDDLHADSDAVLCIDLGGDDRYTGRYGAGVGYASLLIDLGGDDVYDGPDLNFGAGVLGVGLAFDLGGEDQFRGKSICLGAGIAGVGALLKDGGDDHYTATAMAQGFAMHGIGLLLDTRGQDDYRLQTMGQGSAATGGLAWLIDKAGNERYQSQGLSAHPILIGGLISGSQGYADGPGAMGLISDLGGEDDYKADTLAQGFAKEEGVAALMDSDGRDTYVARMDAQCAANSGGAAFLIDTKGDDVYTVQFANGHASSANQGVAMLLDRLGNDLYAGRDSRPAAAIANGTSVFLDVQGDDSYSGQPGIGSQARGSGSIGVFADMAGNDRYAEGLENGVGRATSAWGSALDLTSILSTNQGPEAIKPGSKAQPSDPAMEALFATALANDRQATNELVAIGEPALRWLVARKLGTDGATPDLIAWLALQIGGASEDICVAAIDLTKPAVARDAIMICQLAGFARSGPRVVEAMANPAIRRVAIRAAGALRVVESVPTLIELAQSDDASLKAMAMVALGQIGDARAGAILEPQLESPDPEARLAAVSYFAQRPETSIAIANRLVGSTSERSARTGVQLLSAIGTPESLAAIAKALSDPRRGVVIQALLALDGRVPRDSWAIVSEHRKSADPLVKAVALRIDLGR